jgi:hypothetical protein
MSLIVSGSRCTITPELHQLPQLRFLELRSAPQGSGSIYPGYRQRPGG